MNDQDTENRNYELSAVLGRRKPVVSVRLVRRPGSGVVEAEILAQKDGKASQLKALVERIFQINRLAAHEWDRLFGAPQPAAARWPLLVRLAIQPKKGEGEFRDRFVALPDGTAFSLRLLLLEGRGGDRKKLADRGSSASSGLSFSRLAPVVKLLLLGEAIREEERDRQVRTDPNLGVLLASIARGHGLLIEDDRHRIVDRLRQLLVNNGGKVVLPSRAERASRLASATAVSADRGRSA
jgi:hypothetical protein